MRVYDTYYYNIVEKASFKDARPYLEKMLAETGHSYKNTAFILYSISDDERRRAAEKMPALEKYTFFDNRGGIGDFGFTSIPADWRSGNIYVPEEDRKDVFTLCSKIPRPYNFAFAKLFLEDIDWFPDSKDGIVEDCTYTSPAIPTENEPPYKSNRIMMQRFFDDGKKFSHVYVTIDVTDADKPRSSREIAEKLAPYLGEPLEKSRKCVFPREELDRLKDREKLCSQRLDELAKAAVPAPRKRSSRSDEKIPHVADKFTLNKAFKGTGFERQKGTPNWLNLYSCIDGNGFLYEAYTQKISYDNIFRFWIEISGYNFKIRYDTPDYYVEQEGESLEILTRIAKFCTELRDNFSAELAGNFGATPNWYNNFNL